MNETELAKYKEQGSSNYDDSGFFSVQVIQRAMSIWNLELCPLSSREESVAKQSPEQQDAFICNLNQVNSSNFSILKTILLSIIY